MAYGAWRGMVGTVKPTKGSGSLEELIRMLPDGIGVIPLFNNIRHGTIGEFRDVLPSYEEKVAELAADKVDLIHPAGTPPFMLLGYRREQELIAEWEKKYGVPIFTSGSNQVRALRALGVKKFVGIGYDFEDTSIVERYFTDAGFKVLGLERLPAQWEDIGQLSSREIYRLTKQIFLANPGADASMSRAERSACWISSRRLNSDLQVPVLHPGVATAWEIMLRLQVREPKAGYGRLLADMPAG